MTTLSELYDLAESGTVLVFPTEESARSFSVSYVLDRGRGIAAETALSFDRFSSMFLSVAEGEKAISDMERALFSSYVTEKLSDRLLYFVSPEYPETKSRLRPYIMKMLPHLEEALSIPGRRKEMSHDIALILSEYKDFLASNALYEPSFAEYSIPPLSKDYALIMPSAFPKERRLADILSSSAHIRIIDDLAGETGKIALYGNEKEELRALFIRIRALLDEGVPYSDIVIASAAVGRIRPYLSEEAYLFDIPLVYISGLSPLSYPAGAFLSSLSTIYSSGYSLSSLKDFFLSPSIPFRDSRRLRAFIRRAVEDSITSAPMLSDDRYLKIPDEYGGDYYRLLRFSLDKLMNEKNPGKVLPHIHTLMAGLLSDAQFNENEEDKAVYSFAIRELERFVLSAQTTIGNGYQISEPLFPVFMEYLMKKDYVPRHRRKGIRVYPFSQDAAMPAGYRFLIGINEEESMMIVKDASFLSDYEVTAERDEQEITRDILSLYAATSSHLFISAASETSSGFALPLMSMGREKTALDADDPWEDERKRRERDYILPLQSKGIERASFTALREKKRNEDLTWDMKGIALEDPVSLSFSSATSYEKCPFAYAMKYSFGFSSLPLYEPVSMDNLEIGSRLHSIMERFFRSGCDDAERLEELFSDEMELWLELKRFSPEGAVNMRSSQMRPTRVLISHLRSRFLPNMIEAVKQMNEISSPLSGGRGIEESLRFSSDGFVIEGRIDRIAMGEDGNAIIFDYKKGRKSKERELKDLQAHIYMFLAEKVLGMKTGSTVFVTLTDGEFRTVGNTVSHEELTERLSSSAKGMMSGDWHASPSDTNCPGCEFRGVCRRRFTVR